MCAVFGHATSTRRSVDVCGKGKPEHRRRADQSTILIYSYALPSISVSLRTHRYIKQCVGKDSSECYCGIMSAGPRYHWSRMWTRDRGDAVRWVVRTLAQAFGAGFRRPDWREASRQHPPRWRPVRRSEPRWFSSAPPRRPFQGSREPGYWRQRYFR